MNIHILLIHSMMFHRRIWEQVAAILVDHLGPIHSPTGLHGELLRLHDLLNQYRQTGNDDKHRRQILKGQMVPLLSRFDIPVVSEDSIDNETMDLARRRLDMLQHRLRPGRLDRLGQIPGREERDIDQ
jgi:cobalamin biosynthesis Mg chelatase CobN